MRLLLAIQNREQSTNCNIENKGYTMLQSYRKYILYIYIYIYVCVCVCVYRYIVTEKQQKGLRQNTLFFFLSHIVHHLKKKKSIQDEETLTHPSRSFLSLYRSPVMLSIPGEC